MNESKLWKNWAIWWNEINFNGARSTTSQTTTQLSLFAALPSADKEWSWMGCGAELICLFFFRQLKWIYWRVMGGSSRTATSQERRERRKEDKWNQWSQKSNPTKQHEMKKQSIGLCVGSQQLISLWMGVGAETIDEINWGGSIPSNSIHINFAN